MARPAKHYWRRKRSIVVGVLLITLGSGGFIYLFLFSGPLQLRFWMVPIFLFGVGVAILLDEFFNPVIEPEILGDEGSQLDRISRK
jgi:hypothetical protein